MQHSFHRQQQQLATYSPNKLIANNLTNTSLKQSILITNSSQHSSSTQPFLKLQRNHHPSRVQRPFQNLHSIHFVQMKAQSSMKTYDNSLAIKQYQQPITVAKSMIQLNNINQHQQNNQHHSHQLSLIPKQKSISISSQNNSVSKRKKFISITQRNTTNTRSYYSEQKLSSTTNNNSHTNVNTNTINKSSLYDGNKAMIYHQKYIQKYKTQTKIVNKKFNTQQNQTDIVDNNNYNTKNHSKNQGFSLKQFITPTKSLKQYLSSVINTISRHASQKEQNQQQQQQHVLDQDDNIGGNQNNNNNTKTFSSAEKAKIQRNQIKSVFLLHQKQQAKQQQFRIYTESNQHDNNKNNKLFHKQYNNNYNNNNKQKLILMTQPNHPSSDSRNFMVFEQKIGQNTLTRKDSLILALMEQHENNSHDEKQHSSSKLSLHQIQHEFSPLKLQTPIRTKKSFSLIQQTTQIPQFLIHEKLKQKTQSYQQQKKPSTTLIPTTINDNNKHKQQKIKFISLMEKQQSLRYKNCIDQNVIKDQFINLQNKKTQKIIRECS